MYPKRHGIELLLTGNSVLVLIQLPAKQKGQILPESPKTPPQPNSSTKARLLPPLVLAAFTLLTRLLFHGPPYFADGPSHIHHILQKIYIIQPPGYWLFNRTAGSFGDPVMAISAMNVLFSVAGVVVFYYAALYLAGPRRAFVAALAYSCLFYLWFSGEVHSTYASQVLFPVALFLVLLRYEERRHDGLLALAGLLYATGAGLRPSDGVFLLPMLIYFAVSRLPGWKCVLMLSGTFVLCLGWILPTLMAFSRLPGGLQGVAAYAGDIATQKSIVSGAELWLANALRYVVPLVVGFGPLLGVAILHAAGSWRDWRVRMLVLWIAPGSLFFLLCYISDAPYLNFLSAAVLLLAVGAPRRMAAMAVWNVVFFLGFSPIPSRRLPVNVWNCFAGHFTRYGIEHEWWPNLSTLQSFHPNVNTSEEPH